MTRSEALAAKARELASKAVSLERSWKYSNSIGGWFDDQSGVEELMTQALSFVEHVHGVRHPHYQRTLHWYNQQSLEGLRSVKGILVGMADNIQSGFLGDLEARVTIEISADFLATSQQLADAGDKDPASVLAICVLEDSVKRLAAMHGLESAKDQEFSVVINSLLAKKVIEKSTHSSLMSFKSLRNSAFHAQWHEVSLEAVRMLLMFLPVFLEKLRSGR
ncbi:hypothetical protein [Ramlibacter sp.]|uniref:hypothetical protein n=1 Tax=Ramlibacter sp. TaxID=1917967 RepID=UPI0035B4A680